MLSENHPQFLANSKSEKLENTGFWTAQSLDYNFRIDKLRAPRSSMHFSCRWTAISEQLHFVPPQASEISRQTGGASVVKLIDSH